MRAHTVVTALRRPALRWAAAPLWEAVIASELALHRRLDAWSPPAQGRLDDVTVLVKTFERPHLARRLVESVRRLYPSPSIVVVDDSRHPELITGVTFIPLPYDSGISAGRNAGLAAITTPFFVLCDDDFVFFRGTALAPVLRRMRAHPELDIVGGGVLDLPHYRQVDTRRRTSFGHPSITSGFIAGLERRAVVQNFFIARCDAVRRVGWDPELKMIEHTDFFSRAYGELSVAFDPSCAVLHAKTPFDERYMRHREDVGRYQAQRILKWSRSRATHLRGGEDDRPPQAPAA